MPGTVSGVKRGMKVQPLTLRNLPDRQGPEDFERNLIHSESRESKNVAYSFKFLKDPSRHR